jgi:hypothetical protein
LAELSGVCRVRPKKSGDEKVINTILKAGSPIEYLDAPEFQSYWDADAKILDRIVRKIGRVK